MFSSIAQEILTFNYLIMAWLLLLWGFKVLQKRNNPVFVDAYNYYDYSGRTSKWFALITTLPLILWACFRPDVEDTGNYRDNFFATNASWNGIIDALRSEGKGRGFNIITILIKLIVGNNSVLYFLIIAAIFVGIISYVYRKTTVEYSMAVFLYFISTDFYQWNFHGLRQGLASALVFLASFFLFEKRYVRFAVFMLVAISIHESSIVFLIALLVINQPPWSRRSMYVVVGFALAILFLSQFTNVLENLLEDTNYNNVVRQVEKDDGVNVLRVLVYAVPYIIATVFNKDVREEGDVVVNFSVNMCLFGTAFYVLGMFTSGIYIGRLPIYFTYWNYVLLSWELDRLFDKKGYKVLIIFLMIGFYFYYNYYAMSGFMKPYI